MSIVRDRFPDECEEEDRWKRPRRTFQPDEVHPEMVNSFVRDVFAAISNGYNGKEGEDSGEEFYVMDEDSFGDSSEADVSVSDVDVGKIAEEAAREAWKQYLQHRVIKVEVIVESRRRTGKPKKKSLKSSE